MAKLHSLGTFKMYVCSRFPSFDPPPPPLVRPFRAPLAPAPALSSTQGMFVLARTHPSPPSISIVVKFREKKLIMSTSIFGWTRRVF